MRREGYEVAVSKPEVILHKDENGKTVEPVEEDMAAASILISVPKKRFKRAVKRNLVKRQVREAYRKNKHLLLNALASRNKRLIIAFIWLDNHIHSSAEVEEKVKKLLFHIVERLE